MADPQTRTLVDVPRISAWGWLALALAAASVVFTWLSILVLVGVFIVALTHKGRPAWVVGVLGGVLATAGLMRFIVEEALPGIVQGGQRSAEDRAVSRLREVLWAQDRARELKLLDEDGDGVGEYAPLEMLLTGKPPLVPADTYVRRDVPGDGPAFESGAYLYRVVVPARGGGWTAATGAPRDVDGAEAMFMVYAWPALPGEVGNRAFVLTPGDVVCQSANSVQRYHGVNAPPPPAAGWVQQRDATGCGTGGDGQPWERWKWKKMRFKDAPPG